MQNWDCLETLVCSHLFDLGNSRITGYLKTQVGCIAGWLPSGNAVHYIVLHEKKKIMFEINFFTGTEYLGKVALEVVHV